MSGSVRGKGGTLRDHRARAGRGEQVHSGKGGGAGRESGNCAMGCLFIARVSMHVSACIYTCACDVCMQRVWSLCLLCYVLSALSCIRTAVNLPLPSSTLLGAQHMRMLDPMHARMPQRAPMMPGMPAAKPIIEKMELTHRHVCRALSKPRDVSMHVCVCRDMMCGLEII